MMKYKRKSCLACALVFCVAAMFGCATDTDDTTPQTYFGKDSLDTLMTSSIRVDGIDTTLHDWFEENSFTLLRYLHIDLDDNASLEMVLEIGMTPEDSFGDFGCLILHSENDTLYGNMLYSRAFHDLKSDGSFAFSGGALSHGIAKLTFDADTYTLCPLAEQDFDADENILYTIEGSAVSEQEYEAYLTAYDLIPDASDWILPQ